MGGSELGTTSERHRHSDAPAPEMTVLSELRSKFWTRGFIVRTTRTGGTTVVKVILSLWIACGKEERGHDLSSMIIRGRMSG